MKTKINTVANGQNVANKIAKCIKDTIKGVKDTETLVYAEDCRVNVNIRAFGSVSPRDQYRVMDKMKEFGLENNEVVILQENDGYITFCGFGSYVNGLKNEY